MEKYLNLFKYFSIFLPNQVLDAKKKVIKKKKKKKTGQVLEVSSTGIFLLFFTFWKKVLCTSMDSNFFFFFFFFFLKNPKTRKPGFENPETRPNLTPDFVLCGTRKKGTHFNFLVSAV